MLNSQYKGCYGCAGTVMVGEVSTMQGQEGNISLGGGSLSLDSNPKVKESEQMKKRKDMFKGLIY